MLGAGLNCILKVVKPLYDVPEARKHWFAIYHDYHIDKLGMKQSIYDLYLFYRSDPFNIVSLQTDNTLLLAEDVFADAEEAKIRQAKLMSKDQNYFTIDKSIKFNGTMIELELNGDVTLKQKTHITGISLVTKFEASIVSTKSVIHINLLSKEQYIAQRVKRAYVASICQFEAFFDLSYAVQSTNPTSNDITRLNKRL